MTPIVQTIVTIICAVMASSGFWAFLQSRHDKKEIMKNREDPQSRMLLGLGHDKLISLCVRYIDRGWIGDDEYSDLKKYLYEPYKEMGGNGSVERLMKDVEKLPIKHITYEEQIQQYAGLYDHT